MVSSNRVVLRYELKCLVVDIIDDNWKTSIVKTI
jgi:hypothetical protein